MLPSFLYIEIQGHRFSIPHSKSAEQVLLQFILALLYLKLTIARILISIQTNISKRGQVHKMFPEKSPQKAEIVEFLIRENLVGMSNGTKIPVEKFPQFP